MGEGRGGCSGGHDLMRQPAVHAHIIAFEGESYRGCDVDANYKWTRASETPVNQSRRAAGASWDACEGGHGVASRPRQGRAGQHCSQRPAAVNMVERESKSASFVDKPRARPRAAWRAGRVCRTSMGSFVVLAVTVMAEEMTACVQHENDT